MININESNNIDTKQDGANGPISVTKLKDYGKQAYRPLIDVVYKYQDEFTPYLRALTKGLQEGANALSKDASNGPENYVSQFFNEAAEGLKLACEKLEAKNVKELHSFLSEQADKRPGVMFGTSYIAGMFFGRLSRHVLKSRSKQDESIH
jgi:hypothetical protein